MVYMLFYKQIRVYSDDTEIKHHIDEYRRDDDDDTCEKDKTKNLFNIRRKYIPIEDLISGEKNDTNSDKK